MLHRPFMIFTIVIAAGTTSACGATRDKSSAIPFQDACHEDTPTDPVHLCLLEWLTSGERRDLADIDAGYLMLHKGPRENGEFLMPDPISARSIMPLPPTPAGLQRILLLINETLHFFPSQSGAGSEPLTSNVIQVIPPLGRLLGWVGDSLQADAHEIQVLALRKDAKGRADDFLLLTIHIPQGTDPNKPTNATIEHMGALPMETIRNRKDALRRIHPPHCQLDGGKCFIMDTAGSKARIQGDRNDWYTFSKASSSNEITWVLGSENAYITFEHR